MLPQLHATSLMEDKFATTVRLAPAYDRSPKLGRVRARVFDELHKQVSRASFVCTGGATLRVTTQRGLNNDAEGQSQSRTPEASHSPRQSIWQSFRKPTDLAFAGDRKAVALSATRSRTAVITGRCADLNSRVERLLVRNLPLCPPPSVNAEPLQTQPRAKSH